jgi:hypothetical protein
MWRHEHIGTAHTAPASTERVNLYLEMFSVPMYFIETESARLRQIVGRLAPGAVATLVVLAINTCIWFIISGDHVHPPTLHFL